MTDVNTITIEAQSFQDMYEELETLRTENEKLILENERLNRMKRALMLNNGRLISERNDLQYEVDRLNSKLNNISLWDLSPEAQEEAGHMLARSLLGGK